MLTIKPRGMEICMARLSKGLTQQQLADLIGKHKKSIGNLENGKHNASPYTASKICEVLGKKFEDLFQFGQGE